MILADKSSPLGSHWLCLTFIENRHGSLLALIDNIYPPKLCTLCDSAFNSIQELKIHYNEKHKKKPRYLCIHPHCDRKFVSKGALCFHISRSHLVISAPAQEFLHFHSSSSTPSSPITSPAVHSSTPTSILPSFSSPTLSTSSTLSSPPPVSKKRKKYEKKSVLLLDSEDLSAPSPPPSPFSLYNIHKKASKKPLLSASTESALNSAYPPTQCPACRKSFNRKTNVIKHLTQVHVGQEPYRCIYPDCSHPRLYATREGLVYHIVRAHQQ
ncbi:hypothetical protein BY458DRAFT_535586 [Sporodiniella umbellata]|nr:hypothetical protein BY458DRAFT_535586 [Sporodiniella umbellata]